MSSTAMGAAEWIALVALVLSSAALWRSFQTANVQHRDRTRRVRLIVTAKRHDGSSSPVSDWADLKSLSLIICNAGRPEIRLQQLIMWIAWEGQILDAWHQLTDERLLWQDHIAVTVEAKSLAAMAHDAAATFSADCLWMAVACGDGDLAEFRFEPFRQALQKPNEVSELTQVIEDATAPRERLKSWLHDLINRERRAIRKRNREILAAHQAKAKANKRAANHSTAEAGDSQKPA